MMAKYDGVVVEVTESYSTRLLPSTFRAWERKSLSSKFCVYRRKHGYEENRRGRGATSRRKIVVADEPQTPVPHMVLCMQH